MLAIKSPMVLTLEASGHLDPDCLSCQKYFYSEIEKGKNFSDIFAPRHKPSERCESGKRPHCTCDTCF